MPTTTPLSPERRKLSSAKAIATRWGHTTEADRLDTELRTARLADHIRDNLHGTPPLTPEQRLFLAALLLAGGVQ
jgi:hypothetical protein